VRTDFSADEVRRFAKRAKDAAQARRLLALFGVRMDFVLDWFRAMGCVILAKRCEQSPSLAPSDEALKALSATALAIDKHGRLADVGPILDLPNKKLSDVRT
jgi:hypothetical protein